MTLTMSAPTAMRIAPDTELAASEIDAEALSTASRVLSNIPMHRA